MKEYERELFTQRTPYLQWLREQEEELERQYGKKGHDQGALGKQIHTLPFSSCMDRVGEYRKFQEDVIYLFAREEGKLSDYAELVFSEAFGGDADLVYADEDYRGSLGELYGIEDGTFGEEITGPYCLNASQGGSDPAYYRGEPWFKPDFSPDTLASFFYIGSIFAISGKQILGVTGEYGNDISIYELVYRLFMAALDREGGGRKGVVHIPVVLYTNDRLADAERLDSSERIKALYLEQNRTVQDRATADMAVDKVSIVIPSKDNAEVLGKCLETVIQYTDYSSYEIIIVDNGSNSRQRMCITHIIDGLKREKKCPAIQYLYHEMEFNFSVMCNIGARSAGGSYLLFLNDDVEVLDTEEGGHWLDEMMLYARKRHVGAVGAKLYYPHGREGSGYHRIQHAGITNMGIGPAHKLGGMVDAGCLYHGRNTQNYDMLAVTAACMLIRRSVFDEVGGFDETFPVAYNDVELCFRLYERGYFNVQVNEAVLIHHESLSRGQDSSPEKQGRLAVEKERLYQKHALLNARDPFYSPNLVQWKKDVAYNTGYLYAYDRQSTPRLLENDGETGKRKRSVFKRYDIRNLLQSKYKTAAKIYDWLTGYHKIMFHIDSIADSDVGCDGFIAGDIITDGSITGGSLTIEGWCAIRDTDNAEISRKLWLIYMTRNFNFRNVYEYEIAPKLREDVTALLEKDEEEDAGKEKTCKRITKNTSLSGIRVNIKKSDLKPGTYRIGVLCENKLVCDLEKNVTIPDGIKTGDRGRGDRL